jgi:GST-like protein
MLSLSEAPGVARWMETIEARPAVARGLAIMAEHQQPLPMSDQTRDLLFGKTQNQVR